MITGNFSFLFFLCTFFNQNGHSPLRWSWGPRVLPNLGQESVCFSWEGGTAEQRVMPAINSLHTAHDYDLDLGIGLRALGAGVGVVRFQGRSGHQHSAEWHVGIGILYHSHDRQEKQADGWTWNGHGMARCNKRDRLVSSSFLHCIQKDFTCLNVLHDPEKTHKDFCIRSNYVPTCCRLQLQFRYEIS